MDRTKLMAGRKAADSSIATLHALNSEMISDIERYNQSANQLYRFAVTVTYAAKGLTRLKIVQTISSARVYYDG